MLEQYASRAGLKVYVKTNLGPELLVYDARAPLERGGIIKAGAVVRDSSGREVTRFGEYPATDRVLAGALIAAAALLAYLIGRGLAH